MILFFKNLFQNIIYSFSGKKIFFHIGAVLSTYILVVTGFDWFYFTHTQFPFLQVFLFPAIVIGGLLPIFLPPILYGVGKIRKSLVVKTLAIALLQAAIAGSFISSLYKAITGRIQPDMINTAIDISNGFQFGFLNHGIFWGWPSSHTTIAFAMAITFMYMLPDKKLVRVLALLYAFYIGIGISANIHWFSEFIAGGLIGTAIGVTIGKSFFQTKLPQTR